MSSKSLNTFFITFFFGTIFVFNSFVFFIAFLTIDGITSSCSTIGSLLTNFDFTFTGTFIFLLLIFSGKGLLFGNSTDFFTNFPFSFL
jgi:hypothetical protein